MCGYVNLCHTVLTLDYLLKKHANFFSLIDSFFEWFCSKKKKKKAAH